MTAEELDAAGKTAYEAWRTFWQPVGGTDPPWEELLEIDITVWCKVALAVIDQQKEEEES